ACLLSALGNVLRARRTDGGPAHGTTGRVSARRPQTRPQSRGHPRNTGVEPDAVRRSPLASKRVLSARRFRSPAARASADVWTEYAPKCNSYGCGTAEPRTNVAPAPSAPASVIGASLASKIPSSPCESRSLPLRAPLAIATQPTV